jgi:hypothetical protein
VFAVSDRALIILAAEDGSFAHDGMSPQRSRKGRRLRLREWCSAI